MNKILFIDDDPVMLLLCKAIIKKSSSEQEIVTAQNGQDAIEYYAFLTSVKEDKGDYPELIFLDLNMPIMNGWEFLDEFIKYYYKLFPKTKIVILSSSINPKDKEKALEYSIVSNFITKPLTSNILADLNSQLLSSNTD